MGIHFQHWTKTFQEVQQRTTVFKSFHVFRVMDVILKDTGRTKSTRGLDGLKGEGNQMPSQSILSLLTVY